MATTQAVLPWAQVVVFLVVAAASCRSWLTHRTRPAALLATAFAILGCALLLSRLRDLVGPGRADEVLAGLVLVGLAAFPWLLTLFAWSFERRLPRWLLGVGGWVVVVGVWALVRPPTPPAGSDAVRDDVFVAVFILVWTGLALVGARRLWREGRGGPLVRARMRMMAAASLVLTAALLLAGTSPQRPWLSMAASALAILAALLFLSGFAPPRGLRTWWRRRFIAPWQQMQSALIGAQSPREAAGAVVPLLANTIGGGALVVDEYGDVLAHAGVSEHHARHVAARVAADEPPPADEAQLAVGGAQLVIHRAIYTPLFGQDERELIDALASQLRLALQRTELFEEKERIGRELEQSHADLQAMMVGLAHDLRNPSVTISGFASLARATTQDDERDEMLASIETSAQYLHKLIDSLLELARAGTVQPGREPVELNALLDGVTGRLSSRHPGVRVERDDLPVVAGDPVMLEQVFENLLGNAARHGGRQDLQVEVRYEQQPLDHCLRVSDNGQGIPEPDRSDIFAPFRRGRDAAAGGHGIGLGLVRRILEAHDGGIELVAAERGVTFELRLPTG